MNSTAFIITVIVVLVIVLLFIKNMRDKKKLTPEQTGDSVETTREAQENREEKI